MVIDLYCFSLSFLFLLLVTDPLFHLSSVPHYSVGSESESLSAKLHDGHMTQASLIRMSGPKLSRKSLSVVAG